MKHNKNDNKNYKPQDPAKKKVCKFCGHNEYNEKYTKHLRTKHSDIMEKRTFIKNISKHLTAEQLEAVKQFIIKLKKN